MATARCTPYAPAILSPDVQSRYLARMSILETLLRQQTWFTDGTSKSTPSQPITLAEGWLARFQIDGAVHEFNCNWIAGLDDYANGRNWEMCGQKLATVLALYFERVKP